MMDRVFLDANVLFSAAYDFRCRMARLWRASEVELLVSGLVCSEALRNLQAKRPGGLKTLRRLLQQCQLVDEGPMGLIPPGIELAEKDRPILSAAIGCQANYLLTGDTHFRPLFGRTVVGVTIMRPGDYLTMRGH